MKIAISGAAGTGKTLLAEQLADLYKVPLMKEGVREFLKDKQIDHFRGMSPSQTMAMQWYVLNKKMEMENNLESLIADRSTADNACYALRWCARETQSIPISQMKHYLELCEKHCKTYDVVFVLPTGIIELENDGLRSQNENYQFEMECLILGILLKWDIPFEIIREKTIEERIGHVQETLHYLFR